MITRIEATRYRCLEFLNVDLKSLAVLVGANGSGKTTFLDIPGLLGDSLRSHDISQAFLASQKNRPPRSATLKELVFAGLGDEFVIAVEVSLPDEIVSILRSTLSKESQSDANHWLRYARYEIRFGIIEAHTLTVRNEYLFLFSQASIPDRGENAVEDGSPSLRVFGEASAKKDWRFVIRRHNCDVQLRAELPKNAKSKSFAIENHILTLPRIAFESNQEFVAARGILNLLTSSSVFYSPDIGLLQTASPPGLSKGLMSNAQNLPWQVLELQRDVQRFQSWVEHVKTALPQICGIQAREREDDHYAYLVINYIGGYEVTSSGLSEGTLRILTLTILPYLKNLPAILITEEPENGIHPQAIEAVLQSLGSVYDSQVLISSHSPVVLAMSNLEQIMCSRLSSSGAAEIIHGSEHPRLRDWKGTVDLGTLFAAGVLR